MRGACLEDCRDVDTGYQSKLPHRARSERGDERKPTIDDYLRMRIGNTNDLRQRSLRPWVPSP